MTKTNDQLDTRSRLLDAAVLEMAEKGWGGLRTRALAERAGVNKALVHYHFGSMDALRVETAAHVLNSTVNRASVAVLQAPTLAEGVRRFCAFLDAFSPNDPKGIVLMETMILVARVPELEAMMLRILDVYEQALADRIRLDIAEGNLPPETDIDGLATGLTALLDGLGLHAYMRPELDFTPTGEALAALLESRNPQRTYERSN